MGSPTNDSRRNFLPWAHLVVGLLAVGVLLAAPSHCFTHHHHGHHNQNQNAMAMLMGQQAGSMFANNPIQTFIVFQSIVGATLTPNNMFNQGEVNLLLFEFAVDMFLAGQIPDAELIQFMQLEASMNRQMGL